MLCRNHFYGIEYSLLFKSAHNHRCLVHTLWPFVRLPNGNGREIHDRRLFGDCSAIRDNAEGVLLQLVVVHKTKWFHKLDKRIFVGKTYAFKLFARSGMCGNDNPFVVLLRNGVERLQQIVKIFGRVYILFPMCTDDEILAGAQVFLFKNVGLFNLCSVISQYLGHGRTCFDNGFGPYAL